MRKTPLRIRAALGIAGLCASGGACTAVLGIGDPTVAGDGANGEVPTDGTIESAADASEVNAVPRDAGVGVAEAGREAGPGDADATVGDGPFVVPVESGPAPDHAAEATVGADAAGDVEAGPGPTETGKDVSADGPVATGVGDPCKVNTDCASNFCHAPWCTAVCTTSAMCGLSSTGLVNVCASPVVDGGPNVCHPGCSQTSGCPLNTSCVPFRTADGTFVGVCVDKGAPGGKDGDKCSSNADCTSGYCTEAFGCTEVCSSSTACGSNSAGVANICVSANDGLNLCYPGCSSTSQCKAEGLNSSCVVATTVENNVRGGCGYELSSDGGLAPGKDGDKCTSGTNCASGDCAGWCTEVCSANQQCGTSSVGAQGACVMAADGLNLCFPGCSSTSQCQSLNPNATCIPSSTIDNTQLPGCSIALLSDGGSGLGKDGDKCASGADCASGYCNGSWCTEICGASQACGSSSAGIPNACVKASSGNNVCFPGCATTAQCQTLDVSTTCIPITTVDNTQASICSK